MTATGWTWDYCRDHMDLPRAYALKEHWRGHPPLSATARMIAQALGVEFQTAPALGSSSAPAPEDDRGLAEAMTMAVPSNLPSPRMGLPTASPRTDE